MANSAHTSSSLTSFYANSSSGFKVEAAILPSATPSARRTVDWEVTTARSWAVNGAIDICHHPGAYTKTWKPPNCQTTALSPLKGARPTFQRPTAWRCSFR
ncbi:unnamed protein product [Ectocarpus sp. 6 AP-2014]